MTVHRFLTVGARCVTLLLATLLGPLVSHSARAETTVVSEDEVFLVWLKQGREVAALRTKVGAARFDVVTAALWPNPQLSIAGGVLVGGQNLNGTPVISPQLTVAVPVFGQVAARKSEAVANLRLAEVEVLNDLWGRAGDIQSAMLERAFADAEASELEQNPTELERIDRVVKERAAAGANSSYDILRVSTTEATFRAALAGAVTRRSRAEASLLATIAVPTVGALPVTRDSLRGFRGPESLKPLVEFALEHRPDLQLARWGVTAATARASRLRRENWPIPSITVGPAFSVAPASTTLQAGISIPLPLLDRNQGLIGRALVEAEGQRSLAQAVDQRIRIEVASAWQARARARAALEAFQQGGLHATTELLERAEVSYRVGSFAILDLLDAYRAVWDARAQALELEHTVAEAEADLEHAAALLPL